LMGPAPDSLLTVTVSPMAASRNVRCVVIDDVW
jgi:hypothetical protein